VKGCASLSILRVMTDPVSVLPQTIMLHRSGNEKQMAAEIVDVV
jgi:hypothetical protein